MPTSNDSPTAGEINETEGGSYISTPVETNFPPEPEELPTAEEAGEAEVLSEAVEGDVFATYIGQQPSHRILTVNDLRLIGDKDASEPLVWDRENRFVRNIKDEHPMVVRYIEDVDGGFKVERF